MCCPVSFKGIGLFPFYVAIVFIVYQISNNAKTCYRKFVVDVYILLQTSSNFFILFGYVEVETYLLINHQLYYSSLFRLFFQMRLFIYQY